MKKKGFIVIPVFMLLSGYAQNKMYDASAIPEELKKNSYSVIREEQIEFEVKAAGKATYKVHKAVTVLNENGSDELVFREFTDQFRSLESVSIQLLDSMGYSL